MAGSQAPYIMPDGSGKRLAQFLTDNVLDTQSKRNGSKGLERKWKMHDSQRGHRDPDVEQLLAVGRGMLQECPLKMPLEILKGY